MDWFRNLSPRGKRIAIIAGGAGLAVVIIMISRRGSSAPAASSSTADSVPPAGELSSAYLPNSGYDSSTSADLADLHDQLDELRGVVAATPGASDIAQIVSDQLQPVRDDLAATRNLVTQPVVAPQAPETSAPQPAAQPAPTPTPAAAKPAPAPIPNALPASAGGRQVGPWATAAMRDKAVAGIAPNKVRKFSSGGKFYAEIWD